MQHFLEGFAFRKQKFMRSNLLRFDFIGFLMVLVFTNVGSIFAFPVFQDSGSRNGKATQTPEQKGLTKEQEGIFRKEFLSPGSFIFEGKVLDHSNIDDGTNTYGVLTLDIYRSYGASQKCGQVVIRTPVVTGKVKNTKTGETIQITIKHSPRSEGFGLFSCYDDENKKVTLQSSFLYLTPFHPNACLMSAGRYLINVDNYTSVYSLLGKFSICKDMSGETRKYQPYQEQNSGETLTTPKKASSKLRDFLKKKEKLRETAKAGKVGDKSVQANVDINYHLSNPTVTEAGGNKFLEFDIEVFANQAGYYLDQANIWFDYNTGVFGNNIDANNNVTVTRGPSFPIAKYPYLFTNDASGQNNRFNCVMSADVSNQNRNLLPTVPTVLYRVKIKISNCGPDLNIAFSENASMQGFSFFALSSNAPDFESFQNAFINNWPPYKACTPYIESIVNSAGNLEFTAGTYDNFSKITIKGKFFGQQEAGSKLFYSDADNPTAAVPGVESETNNLLPVGWTDTEIRADVMGESTIGGMVSGTGKIRVINDFNYEMISNQSIEILFNLFDGDKLVNGIITNNQRFRMSRKNVASPANYQIQVVPALASNAPFMRCLKAVVKRWNCTAGTNLEISDQAYLGVIPVPLGADNLSVIYVNNGIGSLAACTNKYEICHGKQSTEFDIAVKLPADAIYEPDPSTGVANPQKDVYGILLHEMGHGIGLNHTTNKPLIPGDPDDVMFPFRDNVPPRVAVLHATDISGANASTSFSAVTPACGGAGNFIKQLPATCGAGGAALAIGPFNLSSWCVPGFSTPATTPGITTSATGGVPPYTYVWTPKANNNATLSSNSVSNPTITAATAPYLFSYDLSVIDNSDVPQIVTITITRQLTTSQTSNLAMHDAADDQYAQPLPANTFIFESPDLWNRNTAIVNLNNVQPAEYVHQEMEFKGSNQNEPNNRLFLYNRIQNLGCVANPAGTATLRNYWTLGATGESWPWAWTEGTFLGNGLLTPVKAGLEITNTTNYPTLNGPVPIAPLNPGESKVYEQPWFPPRPQNFSNYPAPQPQLTKINVCGLSRIESTQNPPPVGVIPGEQQNVPVEINVRASNDIVTHNMWVLNPNGYQRPPRRFVDRGFTALESPVENSATINLTYDITPSTEPGTRWQDIAEIALVFNPDEYRRIAEANITETGFRFDGDHNRIVFTDDHVEIRGIPVDNAEKVGFTPYVTEVKRFENSVVSTSFEQRLILSVTSDDWKDPTEKIGGHGYYLRFNADNPDGSFDNKLATYYDGHERYYVSNFVDTYGFGQGPFTLEAQIRVDHHAPEHTTILSWYTDAHGGFLYGLRREELGYSFYLVLNDNVYLSNIVALDDETCYHVAVTQEAGMLSFYVDGQLVSKLTTLSEGISDRARPLSIGAAERGEHGFIGLIDEVRIWNANMNPDVLARYAAGNTLIGNEPNLLGLWSFEEGRYSQQTFDATSNAVNLQRGATDDVDGHDPAIVESCIVEGLLNKSHPSLAVVAGTAKVESYKNRNPLMVSLAPNPTNSTTRLRIDGVSNSVDITVTSAEGVVLSKESFDVSEKSFSTSVGKGLSPGVYFVRVSSGQLSRVVKFIKY